MRKRPRPILVLALGVAACGAAALLNGCPPAGSAAASFGGQRLGPTSDAYGSPGGVPMVGFGVPAFPVEKYYPLKRFFAWIYTVSIKAKDGFIASEDTYRVETLEESSSRAGTMSLKRTIGGAVAFEGLGTVTMTGNLITRRLVDQSETIMLPLKPDLEWTSGTLLARSFGVDKLTAGGVTYKDLIGISYARDGEVVAVRWLAPRKGIVKELTRIRTDDDVIETVSELKKAYTVGIAGVNMSPTSTVSLTPAATAGVAALVTLEEDGLTSQEVSFSSSNQAVATIAKAGAGVTGVKAVVTGVATGSAVLTARSDQDPTKLATVSVTVN